MRMQNFNFMCNFLLQVEFMPEQLLDTFLWTFGNSSYNIIWQTNSDVRNVLKNKKLPFNVFIHRWLPIKILLGLEQDCDVIKITH